jgi:YfiH family protein
LGDVDSAYLIAPNLAAWHHGFSGRGTNVRYMPADAVARALGVACVAMPIQVHGDLCVDAETGGEADAILSRGPHAAVVRAADCVPILLARHDSVAAVHAGWRGTLLGIAAKVALRMGSDTRAAVGPAIGPCCLRVTGEVAERFGTAQPNLWELNAQQLRQAGVVDVWVAGVCTVCDGRFFSHRRDGEATGRQASFIRL